MALCLSQVGVLSKRMDWSSWVWHEGFRSILRYFPLELCHKLWTFKISPCAAWRSSQRVANFRSTKVKKTGPSSVNYVNNTCDGQRLVYHTGYQPLYTARLRRTGSSATANTCYRTHRRDQQPTHRPHNVKKCLGMARIVHCVRRRGL